MSLIKEADFGTPASPLKETVSVEIDGLPATATAGVSIMRAAREMGRRCAEIVRHRQHESVRILPSVRRGG